MVTLQDMADALDLKPKKDHKGFAAYGEIKSINPDNTYQVSLNGSDTTVKCARLTGAHVGDVVLVNVLDNGYAVVTGCVGGDTDAGDALDLATDASEGATTALNVAEGVNDHFWYDNTGAHVTEDTQEDYQQDPSNAGGNALMTSQGMAVRKGTKELASMSQDGFDAKSYDSNDNEVVIAHLGYGPGTNSGGGTSKAPYYDIGTRASGSTKGNYSVIEGRNTTASGYASHSEGTQTTASGYNAHAEGSSTTASGNDSHAQNRGTIAGYTGQTAIGAYNENKSSDLFEIGNGSGPSGRSNAFEVSVTGDITAPGKATLGAINGDQLFDYSSVSMTSSSINANASGEVTSSASNKAKYYPIAITNVNISTGQASLRRFYFSTQQTGKAVVKIGLQNDGTSAKTISVSADILWVKIAV